MGPMNASDPDGDPHDLLDAAQRGDELALARLLAPHWCGLKLFCGLMLGDADAADRALTETARTARSEAAVIESAAAIRMWIHRIAMRVCVEAIDDGPAEDDQHGADEP
jgi:DNA-directed RNA polymerase specialized sigma24 family protein